MLEQGSKNIEPIAGLVSSPQVWRADLAPLSMAYLPTFGSIYHKLIYAIHGVIGFGDTATAQVMDAALAPINTWPRSPVFCSWDEASGKRRPGKQHGSHGIQGWE